MSGLILHNGANSVKTITDYERELHIQHAGYLMGLAMHSGNREETQQWLRAQMLAIRQRSPAQQARMTTQIERAIDEGNDYFAACGTRDGQKLKAQARHA